jgi:hypothetical protein
MTNPGCVIISNTTCHFMRNYTLIASLLFDAVWRLSSEKKNR